MSMLSLTPDELLSTTRAVRRRLDLSRPVEPEVLLECLRLAQQAPTGSNAQNWHFVVVTDAAKRKALAELYREVWAGYLTQPYAAPNLKFDDPARAATQIRVTASAQFLADHLHEVPVFVIPCITGRFESGTVALQASMYGCVLPAAWSFMLAARSRGLGTSWTTLHLSKEQAAAAILGIPFATVTQAALIPVAYTKGTEFKAGPRDPLENIVHWNRW
jgi:nitroreductase